MSTPIQPPYSHRFDKAAAPVETSEKQGIIWRPSTNVTATKRNTSSSSSRFVGDLLSWFIGAGFELVSTEIHATTG